MTIDKRIVIESRVSSLSHIVRVELTVNSEKSEKTNNIFCYFIEI
jgi:hypothetical protein